MKHLNACYTVTDAGEVKAIVLMEDAPVHTAENGYRCDDPTCPCNEEAAEAEKTFNGIPFSQLTYDDIPW